MSDMVIGGLISIISIIIGALLSYYFSIKLQSKEKSERYIFELYNLINKLTVEYYMFCSYEGIYNENKEYKGYLIEYDKNVYNLSAEISKTLLFIKDKTIVREIIEVLYLSNKDLFPSSNERLFKIYEVQEMCEQRINRIYNTTLKNTSLRNRMNISQIREEVESGTISTPGVLSPISMEINFKEEDSSFKEKTEKL